MREQVHELKVKNWKYEYSLKNNGWVSNAFEKGVQGPLKLPRDRDCWSL